MYILHRIVIITQTGFSYFEKDTDIPIYSSGYQDNSLMEFTIVTYTLWNIHASIHHMIGLSWSLSSLFVTQFKVWLRRLVPISSFPFKCVTMQLNSSQMATLWLEHDDVIKLKHFPHYWPFVRGIHRSPMNSPHKGQWRGALMFSSICAWMNDWVNNRETGYFSCHRAHYDVTVMFTPTLGANWIFWSHHSIPSRYRLLSSPCEEGGGARDGFISMILPKKISTVMFVFGLLPMKIDLLSFYSSASMKHVFVTSHMKDDTQ